MADVDTSSTQDTTGAHTAPADAGSVQQFPTSVSTPPLDLGSAASDTGTEGVIADDGSIKEPGSKNEARNQQKSLTTPDTATQTTDAKLQARQPAERDWEAELAKKEQQLRSNQAKYTADQMKARDLEKRFDGIDADTVRRFKEQEAKSKAEKLPAWNNQNPGHGKFLATIDKWKTYKDAVSNAQKPRQGEDPAAALTNAANRVAVIKEAYGATFSQSEADQITAWEGHQQDFNQRLAMDPEGTFRDLAMNAAKDVYNQERMVAQADHEVGSWMNDPKNADTIKQLGPNMKQALDNGVPWEYAKVLAQQKMEIDRLQSRAGEADRTSTQAKAQQSLLRKNATVTRDGAIRPVKDIAAEAMRIGKEKGWSAADPRYIGLIHQLQQSQG